jgi:hypothetical protein
LLSKPLPAVAFQQFLSSTNRTGGVRELRFFGPHRRTESTQL